VGLVTAEEISQVRRSFAVLERHHELAALVFYQQLFQIDPALRPMFQRDIEGQALKLMNMLRSALALLDSPERLAPVLEELGARHAGYGVQPGHYETVREALMRMLARVLGDGLKPEILVAWDRLYELVRKAMLKGAERAPTVLVE